MDINDYPPKPITTWDSTEYFATQPYERLATVYRQAGQDDQARKVAIARRTDLRKYGKLNWYRKLGNWFLSWSIKYGYQSWRAGIGLAVVFGIFWGLTVLAHRHHLISWAGDLSGFPASPQRPAAPVATRASTRSGTRSIRSFRSLTSTRPTSGARTRAPRGERHFRSPPG